MQSDRFLAFQPRFLGAVDAGLTAAASVYETEVRSRLARGYTTGAFTDGEAAESVERSEPYMDAHGTRAIAVGTDDEMQRYWELGGRNAYTRRFERVEHWRESMMDVGPDMAGALRTAMIEALEA